MLMRLIIVLFCVFLAIASSPGKAETEQPTPSEKKDAIIGKVDTITGHVVAVHDGDTISIFDKKQRDIKIRLAEIDAPELRQPFGDKSEQMLADLILDKDVTIIRKIIDEKGNSIGRINYAGTDVNLSMVRQGGAWAYRQTTTDKAILEAEEFARNSEVGLWNLSEEERIPPWEWREKEKRNRTEALSNAWESDEEVVTGRRPEDQPSGYAAPSGTRSRNPWGFTCDKDSVCSNIRSCGELLLYARYYRDKCSRGQNTAALPCNSTCSNQ